jgi:endonuclease YncB( thermonuclease family)
VERVIDGDTLWAQIECGFDTVIREKLRLRGIDCPELSTPEGKKAKDFSSKKLPAGSTIVITTHKDDKYGRYLADIFCGEEKVFLNQELLNNRLAVIM